MYNDRDQEIIIFAVIINQNYFLQQRGKKRSTEESENLVNRDPPIPYTGTPVVRKRLNSNLSSERPVLPVDVTMVKPPKEKLSDPPKEKLSDPLHY